MKSTTLAAAVLTLAVAAWPAVVAAQVDPAPVGTLTPPAGWTTDQGRGEGLIKTLGREDHFGGGAVLVSAQHLRAPSPGGILITSEVATEAIPSDANAAATLELHAARGGVDVSGPLAKVVRWDVKPDAGGNVAEAWLEWHDDSLGTTSISRTLVFRTKAALIRVAAECIIADDATPLRAPCEAALATLAPLAPVSERLPLVVSAQPIAPTPAVVSVQGAGPAAGPRPPEPGTGQPPDTMRPYDGEIPTTLIVTPHKPKPDRRPYYVFAGLVVVAVVVWWNRKEKARLRAEAHGDKPAGPAAGSGTSDDPKDGDA